MKDRPHFFVGRSGSSRFSKPKSRFMMMAAIIARMNVVAVWKPILVVTISALRTMITLNERFPLLSIQPHSINNTAVRTSENNFGTGAVFP